MSQKALDFEGIESYATIEDDKIEVLRHVALKDQLCRQQHHASISASIVVYSPTITVFVGQEAKPFNVHKELMILQSASFLALYNRTEEPGSTVDGVFLPFVTPCQFANFLIWVNSGTINSDITPEIRPALDDGTDALAHEYEGLWMAGEKLMCPGFMNYCMTKIIQYAEKKTIWPSPDVAIFAYTSTFANSQLRCLVADLLGHNNPLKKSIVEGNRQWQRVIASFPDLALDMIRVDANTEAGEANVWTDKWAQNFMVEEVNIDERWENLILAERNLEIIESEAMDGCLRSIIELKHLERKVEDGDEEFVMVVKEEIESRGA